MVKSFRPLASQSSAGHLPSAAACQADKPDDLGIPGPKLYPKTETSTTYNPKPQTWDGGGGGGRSGFRVKGVGFRGLGFRGLGFRGSGFRGVMSRVLGFRGSVSSFGVSCKGSSKLFSSSRVPLMVPLWVLVRVPA